MPGHEGVTRGAAVDVLVTAGARVSLRGGFVLVPAAQEDEEEGDDDNAADGDELAGCEGGGGGVAIVDESS